MIELTEKQAQELGDATAPVRVVDPVSKREFILLPADRIALSETDDFNVRDLYPMIDRIFGPDWEDPKMSDYDNYEQHRP